MLFALALGVKAQDSLGVGSLPKQKELQASYEKLFQDILQQMPEEVKPMVDSARAARAPESKNKPEIDSRRVLMEQKREAALQRLSPELREKVAKELSNHDNRRKERELEFKELAPKK